MRQLLGVNVGFGGSSARERGLERRCCHRWLLVVAVSLSCLPEETPDDDPPKGPFEIQYRTKYIDLAPGFTQPVCRGTLDELDRHVEIVAEQLDITVEDRIEVFWYNQNATGAIVEDAEFNTWCGALKAAVGGCYTEGVVHTHYSALLHELNHAVVAPAWGWSSFFFSEGVAFGFARSHGQTIHHTPSSKSPSEVMESKQPAGGHFMRWLIEQHGPAKLRELFESSSMSSGKDELFAAVQQVYGVPFEELEAEYFATAATIYPMLGLCEDLVDIPWNGNRWELTLDADCDAPYMHGPDNAGKMLLVVAVDVPPEYVEVPLAAWSPTGVEGYMWPCLDEPLHDVDIEPFHTAGFANKLPGRFRKAGRHRVEISVDEPGEVYLRLCPHNGAPPLADETVDPDNCLD